MNLLGEVAHSLELAPKKFDLRGYFAPTLPPHQPSLPESGTER